MRTQFLAAAFLAATASGAFAQQAAAPPMTAFMSDKDIMALVDKAKADRKAQARRVPESAEPGAPARPARPRCRYL